MLQRRTVGKLDFMKRWRQYVAGFGNLTDEFWLGTQNSKCALAECERTVRKNALVKCHPVTD